MGVKKMLIQVFFYIRIFEIKPLDKQTRHQAPKHLSTKNIWAQQPWKTCEHLNTQNTQAYQAPKHAKHVSMQPREHVIKAI